MFDRVQITVRSGDGGAGAISFRKEKFVPYGGPDGGDGGAGGAVWVKADTSVSSLGAFRRKRRFRAENGQPGGSRKCHGRRGEDLWLAVPVGTVVTEAGPEGPVTLVDLEHPEQEAELLSGGRGGRGNIHFATSTNQVPQIAQAGEAGETREIVLEMRLIADAGILGYPNAGKSTLLTAVSAARPKIAEYPFTTLEPSLGVVETGADSFVLADIPGLVEDAHAGKGLGHDFLRHLMRTRVLIHLVDGAAESPYESYRSINRELALFDWVLIEKPQVVAINKTDLPEARERLDDIIGEFAAAGVTVHPISAKIGQGTGELVQEVWRRLRRLREPDAPLAAGQLKVFRPRPKTGELPFHLEDGVFVITAPEAARLITRGSGGHAELKLQLRRYLTRAGITRELARAGIEPGDRIRLGKIEWTW